MEDDEPRLIDVFAAAALMGILAKEYDWRKEHAKDWTDEAWAIARSMMFSRGEHKDE